MRRRRGRDVADQSQGAGLEDADGGAGDKQQGDEIGKLRAEQKGEGGNGEQAQTQDDRRFAPQSVSEKPQPQARQSDAGHRRVLKRARGRHAEVEGPDQVGNDDADRIRGHGEHHEHQIGQGGDQPWALRRRGRGSHDFPPACPDCTPPVGMGKTRRRHGRFQPSVSLQAKIFLDANDCIFAENMIPISCVEDLRVLNLYDIPAFWCVFALREVIVQTIA